MWVSRASSFSTSSGARLYNLAFRSAGVYWTAIIGATVLGGFAFDSTTNVLWESWNRGKLFHHVIGTFPEKVGGDEEEEKEE
jgi:hypothetical protein